MLTCLALRKAKQYANLSVAKWINLLIYRQAYLQLVLFKHIIVIIEFKWSFSTNVH